MCIRDSGPTVPLATVEKITARPDAEGRMLGEDQADALMKICLLYTSDAADERSSVDLGGRRIIKKNKSRYTGTAQNGSATI